MNQHAINLLPDDEAVFVRDLVPGLFGTTSDNVLAFDLNNLIQSGVGIDVVSPAADGTSFTVNRSGIYIVEFGSQISAGSGQQMGIGRDTTLPYTGMDPSWFQGGTSIIAAGEINTNGTAGVVMALTLSRVQIVTQADVDAGGAVFRALASDTAAGPVGGIADAETWFAIRRIMPILD